jgi:nitrate reductase assembly molybdenum cofactor insertion protein NarJ
MSFRQRRLEDRIRELCSRAVAAEDLQKVKPILAELQSAIHQYTHRLRVRAAALFTGSDVSPDRRKGSPDRRKSAAA